MPQLIMDYEHPWIRQRLHVPKEDETLFAAPPLDEATGVADANRATFANHDMDIQGRSLQRLRSWCREQILRAARRYTEELTGVSLPEPAADTLIAGGHQPTLFHPGVWVKNFALAALARRTGGTALHLVVDNDAFPTSRIAVPVGDRRHPVLDTLPFDDDRHSGPWEEVHVADRRLFASFADRLARVMARWDIEPLAVRMWPAAVQQMDRSGLLRDSLTAARHSLEHQWDVRNLELPLSRLCETEPFLWFAAHLLAHLPDFRDIHNRVLAEYREINRIRSRTRPVSDLREADGWFEAPFWIWHEGDRRRGRLFARQVGREVHLSDGESPEPFAKLPLSPEMDACCAVEVLRELPKQGIRIRTRALTTTLFGRLCLSDLFVHGIGGAKYDEITDRIIARFFDLPAPEYLTLSATLDLPLAEPFPVTVEDERRLRHGLRDLDYNSDRHLNPAEDPATQSLIAEKKQLIAEQHAADAVREPRSERRKRRPENYRRFIRFHEIDRQLARHTLDQRRRIEETLETTRQQIEANAILQNREFAFCLYPESKLRPFMTRLGDHSI